MVRLLGSVEKPRAPISNKSSEKREIFHSLQVAGIPSTPQRRRRSVSEADRRSRSKASSGRQRVGRRRAKNLQVGGFDVGGFEVEIFGLLLFSLLLFLRNKTWRTKQCIYIYILYVFRDAHANLPFWSLYIVYKCI